MSFLETPRFPPAISFGATGGPNFRTDIVQTESGWEQRNSPWAAGRNPYDVSHAARKHEMFKELLSHFYAVRGRFHGFRYKDWSDFSAAAGEGVIVTLSGGAKQIAKRYTAGSLTYDRLISKPIDGTVTITGGGTLSYTTGIISGGSPTAWTGDFDVPCRYDTDLMQAEIIDRNNAEGLIMGWSSILLVESVSRTISVALKAHLAGETTTVCTCWKITRIGDANESPTPHFAFTDHDRDLEIAGIIYKAATGYTATNVSTTAALDVDNLNIEGIISDDSITEDDLRAGLWDFAEIEIFVCNWADLSQGKLIQRTGKLGEVTINRGTFTAELRGLTQAYSRVIGERTSPGCRADLGDSRCTVDLTPFTVTGTVTAVDSDLVTISDSGRTEPGPTEATEVDQATSGYFDFGLITFDTGDNAGFSMEIKAYDVGVFVLQLPMPYEVQVGDTYTAIAGCDKAGATCRDKFDNLVNMRAEPWAASTDRVLQVGRAGMDQASVPTPVLPGPHP